MADLPTAITPGVTTGHATDHVAIANWLNAQGFDEGHSILAPTHSGFPGDPLQFLSGDGTFRVPAGGGGGGATGFTSAMGHQYVLASGGSNANNGISPLSAKATIQAAHDALPTNGGTIWLSEGTHTISAQQNISKRGVKIVGAGRTATRLKCGTAGIHMIHWTGADGAAFDFSVTDGTGGDFGGAVLGRGLSGIWVDGAQEVVFDNLRFDGFGIGAGTGLSFDAGPAALRIVCTTGFADWQKYSNIVFRRCYRGVAASSGNNGSFYGCDFYSDGEERVLIEKRTATGGAAATFHFIQCHFAGSGNPNRWCVRIEHGAGSSAPYRMGTSFVRCVWEMSAATTQLGGCYVNGTEVLFAETTMTSGSIPMVRCGPDAGGVKWGRHYGPDPVLQVSAGNTGAMRAWVNADDSGTSANGAIAVI